MEGTQQESNNAAIAETVGAPEQVAPGKPAPRIVEIPESASGQMRRMFGEYLEHASKVNAVVAEFNAFVAVTKQALGIPADEKWTVDEDGTAFIKVDE